MLIKCPHCRSVYDIDDALVPENGLKSRCIECGEIWTIHAEDAIQQKKSSSPKDIKKMFERVSKQTETLFDEREVRTIEKIKVVNITRNKHTLNLILVALLVLLSASILYYMRYDIVRLLPQTEKLYDRMQIASVPYGRNLEFKDITTREFSENNIAKMEISGNIVNSGKYVTEIPPVKIDIFDKNGKPLLHTTHYLPIPRLEAGYNLLFNVIVTNPTPFGKSIYVTFEENL